jgi:hypothetical protein
LQTLCDLDSHINSEGLRTLFFYLNKNKNEIISTISRRSFQKCYSS